MFSSGAKGFSLVRLADPGPKTIFNETSGGSKFLPKEFAYLLKIMSFTSSTRSSPPMATCVATALGLFTHTLRAMTRSYASERFLAWPALVEGRAVWGGSTLLKGNGRECSNDIGECLLSARLSLRVAWRWASVSPSLSGFSVVVDGLCRAERMFCSGVAHSTVSLGLSFSFGVPCGVPWLVLGVCNDSTVLVTGDLTGVVEMEGRDGSSSSTSSGMIMELSLFLPERSEILPQPLRSGFLTVEVVRSDLVEETDKVRRTDGLKRDFTSVIVS